MLAVNRKHFRVPILSVVTYPNLFPWGDDPLTFIDACKVYSYVVMRFLGGQEVAEKLERRRKEEGGMVEEEK